jgi:hypothetical protein
MTDDEVEAVAAELAKAGGVSWHSGEERGPLKLVMDRYRDRARLAVATLDRLRAAKHSPGEIKVEQPGTGAGSEAEPGLRNVVSEGSLVLYRPPGDKRTYPCRVEKVEGTRVYLVPELPTCTGWVDLATLASPALQ